MLLPFLLVLAGITGCTENTVGPGAGSGTLLEATIDGTTYSFPITTVLSSYTVADTTGIISGEVAGSTVRTLQARFSSNIDAGTFPRALKDPEVSFTYIVKTGAVQKTYQCAILGEDCAMTITGKSGNIVDGTFSAMLTNPSDSTDMIHVTNGKFSVNLPRQ
jgi:hypothetical protein